MCKVLGINRSTYYKVANKVDSARTIENQKLDADILAIYFATKRRYGAPKIHHELLNQGWNISLKRVQRRMAELGIHSIVIKKYRHYSSNKRVAEKDNIFNQDFTATGINQKWCTDITSTGMFRKIQNKLMIASLNILNPGTIASGLIVA